MAPTSEHRGRKGVLASGVPGGVSGPAREYGVLRGPVDKSPASPWSLLTFPHLFPGDLTQAGVCVSSGDKLPLAVSPATQIKGMSKDVGGNSPIPHRSVHKLKCSPISSPECESGERLRWENTYPVNRRPGLNIHLHRELRTEWNWRLWEEAQCKLTSHSGPDFLKLWYS